MDKPGIVSVTLADIYHEQGCTDKAIDIYAELVKKEPHNIYYRKRLSGLKKDLKAKSKGAGSRNVLNKKVW